MEEKTGRYKSSTEFQGNCRQPHFKRKTKPFFLDAVLELLQVAHFHTLIWACLISWKHALSLFKFIFTCCYKTRFVSNQWVYFPSVQATKASLSIISVTRAGRSALQAQLRPHCQNTPCATRPMWRSHLDSHGRSCSPQHELLLSMAGALGGWRCSSAEAVSAMAVWVCVADRRSGGAGMV